MQNALETELNALYTAERRRLLLLADEDRPAGEYAAPVFGAGNAMSAVMLIGEAPGAEETRISQPFVGKAGRQLSQLLDLMGLEREQIYITNAVKYRPVVRTERSLRNRTPGSRELESALPLLREEILLIRPTVILTLGNTPLKAVLQLAGQSFKTVGDLHGRPHPCKIADFPFELYPLYHPASGIYNGSLIPVMEQDAAAFGEHLVKLG